MSNKPNAVDFSGLSNSLVELGNTVGLIVEAVTKVLQQAAPGILALIDAVDRMPAILQASLVQLAEEGWYLDWEGMSLQEPAELAEAYLEGRHAEIEGRLVEHYRSRLPEIETELLELIPARAAIIRQVFEAHRLGLYFVTVPTLLAQADGVCLDLLGEHFFMKGRDIKKDERFARLAHFEALTKSMFAPFFTETSIRMRDTRRPADFDKLNRHTVLHGESLDYGTELRSLQAVSLLYYIAITLGRVLAQVEEFPAA